MLEELKREVCEANPELPRRGLITYTWGNVSGIDRSAGLFAIKPSGVEYGSLAPEDMMIVDPQRRRAGRSGRNSRRYRVHQAVSAPQYMIAISIITENTAPEPITGRSDVLERIAAGCYQ